MTGIEKTGTGYGKKRELPVVPIVLGILAVVAISVAWWTFFGTGGSNPTAPGTATAGSPAGPGIFAPDVHKMNFSQLVEAGYLDTPEKIQRFMVDYPFKYRKSTQPGWAEPDEILRSNGYGDYPDFDNFFGEALVNQGCWDKWEVKEIIFSLQRDMTPGDYGPIRSVLSFRDIRNGSYAYFVPNPNDEKSGIPFPIFYTGKENDAARLEAIRLGDTVDRRSGGTRNLCEF